MAPDQTTPFQVTNQEHQGDTLMNLLRILGEAYLLMQKYNCAEAEDKISKLTSK